MTDKTGENKAAAIAAAVARKSWREAQGSAAPQSNSNSQEDEGWVLVRNKLPNNGDIFALGFYLDDKFHWYVAMFKDGMFTLPQYPAIKVTSTTLSPQFFWAHMWMAPPNR